MGCGAVCGNSSSIYQPNQYSQKILLQLAPQLTHASKYISQREYNAFLTQIKENPLKYRLKLSQKLTPKQQTDPGILVKWKLILYCFDSRNPDFVNCLDHKFKINTTVGQNQAEVQQCQQNQEPQHNPTDQDERTFPQTQPIYWHQQFPQIEKDIDRTCDLSQGNKQKFQRILKRLTNYFPQMGYTQGINFIIGYLLMVGFSQFDAFWMFVHIAIHKRYLQLGLLQDKFPLSQVYNRIFRNILKRINYPLYRHLYEVLMMDESVWVFKWFITYFIYSFPFEMIKYVFDIVIELGGIGLIKLAVAITMELSHVLIEEHDVCEISLFFQSLRNIDTFNEYLSISRLLDRAYKLQIGKEDFAGIEEYQGNFYSDYIVANLQMQQSAAGSQQIALTKVEQLPDQKNKKKASNNQKSSQNPTVNKLLKTWYQKLIHQRQTFLSKKQLQKNPQPIDQKKPNTSIENSLHLIIRQDQDSTSLKSPQKQNSINQNKNSIKDSVEVKKQSVPSTGYSFNKKSSGIHNPGDVSEIDEMWQQEDRNSSISKTMNSQISQQSRTQNGFNPKLRKISYQDELDKLASTHCNPSSKLKTNTYNSNNYNKVSSIFNQDKLISIKPKINNFQIPSDRAKRPSKGNNLVRAGQHILNNFTVNEHSQHESSNSEYSKMSQKEKRSKENEIYGKNYFKNKSKKLISFEIQHSKRQSEDIKSHDVHQHNSSSRDSFIDPQNSFYASNEFIHQDLKNNHLEAGSVKAFESHRERMNTHQDALTTSLHASHVKENVSKEVGESHVSEIVILQAPQPQVFKKKNRVSSRINGALNEAESFKAPKLSHTISQLDIKQKGQKSAKTLKMGIQQSSINYEESYESIFVPSEGKKSNTFRFHQQLQKCEVESVK